MQSTQYPDIIKETHLINIKYFHSSIHNIPIQNNI